MKIRRYTAAAVLLAALAASLRGCSPADNVPTNPPETPRKVVVVHETLDTAVPVQVLELRERLADSDLAVVLTDPDIETPEGDTPAELAAAIAAATENGLPAVVVTSLDGAEVLDVFSLPATADELEERILGKITTERGE